MFLFFFKQTKTVSLADVTEPVLLDFSVVAEDNFTFKLFIIGSKQGRWRGTTGLWQMLQSTARRKSIFPSRCFPKSVQVCLHKSGSDYKVVAARFTTETLHKVKRDERWCFAIPHYVLLCFDEVGSVGSYASFQHFVELFHARVVFLAPELPRTTDCSKSHTAWRSWAATTMAEKTLKSFLVESSSNKCTLLTDIFHL